MIGPADSLEPELSDRLESLDAIAGYDRCSGEIVVWRSPIDLGLCIGPPDREYNEVLLDIVDNSIGGAPTCRVHAEETQNPTFLTP